MGMTHDTRNENGVAYDTETLRRFWGTHLELEIFDLRLAVNLCGILPSFELHIVQGEGSLSQCARSQVCRLEVLLGVHGET